MLRPNAGAVEDDLGEEPEAEAGGEQTASDGSVQWAVLRCGRRGQARVGGQGSGRLGRTSCGDDRGRVAGSARPAARAMARWPGDRPGRTLRPDRGRATRAGGRPSWRRPSTELLDDARAARSAARSGSSTSGPGTGQLGARRRGALAGRLDRRRRRLGGDGARWPTRRPTGAARRAAPDAVQLGGRVRRRAAVRRRRRSTRRCRRSSSSSSRTGRARLREARRVLRPGGVAGLRLVAGRTIGVFAPDAIFDEVLDDFGIDAREGDGRSRRHARRSSGRRASCAAPGSRSHAPGQAASSTAFTVDGYIAFLTEFDEETLFAELEPDVRERLLATLRDAPDGAVSPSR